MVSVVPVAGRVTKKVQNYFVKPLDTLKSAGGVEEGPVLARVLDRTLPRLRRGM